MNILMYLSLFLLFVILCIEIFRRYKKYTPIINLRLFFFVLFSSLFIFIPLYEFSAGLASILTYKNVVFRFAFSSLIFIAVPIASFYILSLLKVKKLSILLLLIILIISGTFLYSKHFTDWKNYYRNIISIKNSFNERKVGFTLSKKDIQTIGRKLEIYEKNIDSPLYYAREDIAFVLRNIYQRKVYLPPEKVRRHGASLEVSFYLKAYKKDTKHQNKILFTTPKEFIDYEPYK